MALVEQSVLSPKSSLPRGFKTAKLGDACRQILGSIQSKVAALAGIHDKGRDQ